MQRAVSRPSAPGRASRQRHVAIMAKVKLEIIANNVSVVREGRVYRTGDAFTTGNDDEIERWLALGYVEKAKKSRASR